MELNRLTHASSVQIVSFSQNSSLLATGSQDGFARIFDVATGNDDTLDGGIAQIVAGCRVNDTPGSIGVTIATTHANGTAIVGVHRLLQNCRPFLE